jgi:acetolactate synthase-1/2/3 large subunit
MQLTGAEIIIECLLREGVETVFGYPGGAVLPIYDALTKYPQLRHVLVRHEQAAAHAADGFARVMGKVGVCIATSGPGATNLVTGIANAMLDSIPMVAITGQVSSSAVGSDAFQEVDVTGITLPITKHNYLVTDVEDLAYTLKEAFHIARTGRPGPVLLDITKDAQNATADFAYPDEPITLPGYHPVESAPDDEIQAAVQMINAAQRPVILAGHGVMMADAYKELLAFAERTSTPVALTLLGKGSFPEEHPLCMGMMGMHGTAEANLAIQNSDVLLAFGMRFDDRVIGDPKTYSPNSKKIHVDIDGSEHNKLITVDLPILGDLKAVLNQMMPHLRQSEHAAWMAQIQSWREDTGQRDLVNKTHSGVLHSIHVIRDLWTATEGEAVVATDVGQHQMWVAQYYHHGRPNTLLTSGGLGTMGYGFPAALGAAIGLDRTVWAVVGDGGFQMTLQELGAARQEDAKVKIAIINNGYLGMVRQWQEIFYEERYSATPISSPDYVKLAEAYSVPARRVEAREDVIPAIEWANRTPGPVLVEFVVESMDAVYPMVPSGADLGNMLRRPLEDEEGA